MPHRRCPSRRDRRIIAPGQPETERRAQSGVSSQIRRSRPVGTRRTRLAPFFWRKARNQLSASLPRASAPPQVVCFTPGGLPHRRCPSRRDRRIIAPGQPAAERRAQPGVSSQIRRSRPVGTRRTGLAPFFWRKARNQLSASLPRASAPPQVVCPTAGGRW
jgi:hypothetical protein